MTHTPVNLRTRDASEIEAAVDRALSSFDQLQNAVKLVEKPIDGLNVLELGPGIDFGAQLLLASKGANVFLADPYLAGWDENFHPQFYRSLANRYEGPRSQLDAVIADGGYGSCSLRLLKEPAENLRSIKAGSIDLIFSLAVLEHVYDIASVAAEMARVSASGAIGFHVIDLRDHRNFSRPLEHLIASDQHHLMLANSVGFEFGNRVRSTEFVAHFERNGLEVTNLENYLFAEEDYLKDFLARAQNLPSPYKFWPEEDLKNIMIEVTTKIHEENLSNHRPSIALSYLNTILALKQAGVSSANVISASNVIQLEPESFGHEQGWAWVCSGVEMLEGDSLEKPTNSNLRLFENDVELGPAHSLHADIRESGTGRFSHWGNALMFSTSDNSDPKLNGRKYSFRAS